MPIIDYKLIDKDYNRVKRQYPHMFKQETLGTFQESDEIKALKKVLQEIKELKIELSEIKRKLDFIFGNSFLYNNKFISTDTLKLKE